MKIAILGTRGIPNNYGGFEQCAEKISVFFKQYGHDVTVYCTDDHPYPEDTWNGIKLQRIFNQEKYTKSFSAMIYDYLSLKHAVKQNYNIILELGYNPAGFFLPLARKASVKIITNMDGLEWKRSKWIKPIQKFSRLCEARGVKYSDILISDNEGIQDYLKQEYGKESVYIPYGAELDNTNDDKNCFKEYSIKIREYFMLIARIEPENNIEMILDGYTQSCRNEPFIVVGKHDSKYGSYLKQKYSKLNIRFLGGIYNYRKLCTLRRYTNVYFHGHSVGGTNPSLLEAMASDARIAVHDNPFNRSVVEKQAMYFKTPQEVEDIINNAEELFNAAWIEENRNLIKKKYNWLMVAEAYLKIFTQALNK